MFVVLGIRLENDFRQLAADLTLLDPTFDCLCQPSKILIGSKGGLVEKTSVKSCRRCAVESLEIRFASNLLFGTPFAGRVTPVSTGFWDCVCNLVLSPEIQAAQSAGGKARTVTIRNQHLQHFSRSCLIFSISPGV